MPERALEKLKAELKDAEVRFKQAVAALDEATRAELEAREAARWQRVKVARVLDPVKARSIKQWQQPELSTDEIKVGDVLRLRDLRWLPEGNAVHHGLVVVPVDPTAPTRWQRFAARVRQYFSPEQRERAEKGAANV